MVKADEEQTNCFEIDLHVYQQKRHAAICQLKPIQKSHSFSKIRCVPQWNGAVIQFFQKMMLSLGRNKLKNDILKLKMCMQFSNQSRKHTASELLLKNNKLKKYVKRCNSVAVSFFSCEMGNCERNLFRATNLV